VRSPVYTFYRSLKLTDRVTVPMDGRSGPGHTQGLPPPSRCPDGGAAKNLLCFMRFFRGTATRRAAKPGQSLRPQGRPAFAPTMPTRRRGVRMKWARESQPNSRRKRRFPEPRGLRVGDSFASAVGDTCLRCFYWRKYDL
jgi:hypothetical protein